MPLTRDQIFGQKIELPRQSVDVPELGGSVLIKTFTLKEVGEIQRAQKSSSDALSVYPRLVAQACINEDGSPLFVGEDVKMISELPWPAVDALARAIMKLNRMTDDEVPKA